MLFAVGHGYSVILSSIILCTNNSTGDAESIHNNKRSSEAKAVRSCDLIGQRTPPLWLVMMNVVADDWYLIHLIHRIIPYFTPFYNPEWIRCPIDA